MCSLMSRREILGLGAAVTGSLLVGSKLRAAAKAAPAGAAKGRVIVWSEGTAAKELDKDKKPIYPNDIRGAIADSLKRDLPGWEIVTATIDDPDQGVPADGLAKTDVLFWWGHKLHGKITDETVKRIVDRVKDGGMGFVALHSSHFAKPYKALMGILAGDKIPANKLCSWGAYAKDGSSVDVIVKLPDHPIARGLKDFHLDRIERYGEPFGVPDPEAVPLAGVYTRQEGNKEPGRMGLCWTVGKGKVFYFTPGHEEFPDFFNPNVQIVMKNAAEWASQKK